MCQNFTLKWNEWVKQSTFSQEWTTGLFKNRNLAEYDVLSKVGFNISLQKTNRLFSRQFILPLIRVLRLVNLKNSKMSLTPKTVLFCPTIIHRPFSDIQQKTDLISIPRLSFCFKDMSGFLKHIYRGCTRTTPLAWSHLMSSHGVSRLSMIVPIKLALL